MSEPADHTRAFARPPARDAADAPVTGWRRFVNLNVFGILLMVLAIGWSLTRVLSINTASVGPDVIELRIAHWQLESGFRDALDELIRDYCALHPDKKIVIRQDGVTERVYAQWLNVNLIAGNPPDLAEMGSAKLTRSGDAVAKYFMPLGREVSEPNPYNADRFLDPETKSRLDPALVERLQTAPWRETLTDGMQGGWMNDLQDYYSVPTSFFTQRMYYNKELYAEVFGADAEPPRTLGRFFEVCDRLREWARENGKDARFDPIAANRYHKGLFQWNYRVPFTNVYTATCDTDLSCDISFMESWAAFQRGADKKADGARVDDQPYRAFLETIRRIFQNCNAQFNALDRDQAIADFAQRRAVFLASGSWDAASIFLASDFEVGIFNFPMPGPDEEHGEYSRFPLNEASTDGGAKFGIPKACKHPEIALDFLRFLTSQQYNQKFNRLNGFLPITIGTRPAESMLEFMPNPYGVLGHLNFADGYDLQVKVNGILEKYLLGETKEFTTLVKEMDEAFSDRRNGFDRIWFKNLEKTQDNVRNLERTIAVLSSRSLFDRDPTADAMSRARETILDQALHNQGGNIRLLHQQRIGGDFPEAP